MENKETCYELFGIECGDGWREILKPIFDYVSEYNKEHADDSQLEFMQIKEKFGGLRVYMNFYTEELRELIEKAEMASYETCEMCGSTENVGTIINGWITTCCEDCVKKIAEKRVDRIIKWKEHSSKLIKEFNNHE